MKVYMADVESLTDPSAYQAAYEKAGGKRREKADRFRFPSDKRLCLGAELLLQEALEREGIRDREIEVMPGGKPYLKNTKEWYFNLSHSGTKVMCVLARAPVGCDIEKRKDPPLAIAGKVFSGEEQDRLLQLEGEEQKQYFYRIWTGKESYLKMTGEGLRHTPDDFTVQVPFGRQTVGKKRVRFYEVSCGKDYQGTICKEEIIAEDTEEDTAVANEICINIEL